MRSTYKRADAQTKIRDALSIVAGYIGILTVVSLLIGFYNSMLNYGCVDAKAGVQGTEQMCKRYLDASSDFASANIMSLASPIIGALVMAILFLTCAVVHVRINREQAPVEGLRMHASAILAMTAIVVGGVVVIVFAWWTFYFLDNITSFL